MSNKYPEEYTVLTVTDFMNDAGAKYFADLIKNADLPSGVKIAFKLKLGAAGMAVDAVELTIAASSGDSYRATLETAEFIGKTLGAVGGGTLGPIGAAGGSAIAGLVARELTSTVLGSRDEYLQNHVTSLENDLTVTESRIEEVELEMARLTQGADTDANVTEQGELDRLRQEYVDLQHQRDALNEQIVHARTVSTADETFDYDTDYGEDWLIAKVATTNKSLFSELGSMS